MAKNIYTKVFVIIFCCIFMKGGSFLYKITKKEMKEGNKYENK
jgi:hypothetical protein